MLLKFNIDSIIEKLKDISRIKPTHYEYEEGEIEEYMPCDHDLMEVIMLMDYIKEGYSYNLAGENLFIELGK